MARKYIDCREVPSAGNCSIAISADSDDELVEAACQHAVAVHGETDSPELRDRIRQGIHEGTPPEGLPMQSGRAGTRPQPSPQ